MPHAVWSKHLQWNDSGFHFDAETDGAVGSCVGYLSSALRRFGGVCADSSCIAAGAVARALPAAIASSFVASTSAKIAMTASSMPATWSC